MQPFRRFILPKKWCFVVLLAAALAHAASAQATNALPKAWNDAVSALADRIAAAVSPAHPVTLTVKNISSLDPGETDAVRAALETQLGQHHFRVSRAVSAETQLDVTLSESNDTYVWVAQIRATDDQNTEPELAVVSVAKSSGVSEAKDNPALTLQKTLMWQQGVKFLDFFVKTPPAGTGTTLDVLEPTRVAVYARPTDTWELDYESTISHRLPWPRDVRGKLGGDGAQRFATISGVPCSGSDAKGATISCVGTPMVGEQRSAAIAGHDTGEAVVLKTTCGDAQVALGSGTGDWTQPDAIRGYLVRKNGATVSGAALDFDGPVISLMDGGDGEARAIVLNLKTGNYEGYSVSATCGE
ncbi:MAG: hypothetical protein WA823_07480 [Candidatus Acidiferrales bacterium]